MKAVDAKMAGFKATTGNDYHLEPTLHKAAVSSSLAEIESGPSIVSRSNIAPSEGKDTQ